MTAGESDSLTSPYSSVMEHRGRSIPGHYVVIAMFCFGSLATGLLYLYWNLHLEPFMPLQKAIAAEFRDSKPRVDGGQRKIHKSTVSILRIVIQTDLDPVNPGDAGLQTIDDRMVRLRELADRHTDLAQYDYLVVHFYKPIREQEVRQKSYGRHLATWESVEIDDRGNPQHSDEEP